MRLTAFIASLCILFLAAGCRPKAGVPSLVVTDTIYAPQYAHGFRLLETSQGLLVETLKPWQGSGGVSSRLLIGGESPEGFDGRSLRQPARRIVVMSSTHMAMLRAIGRDDAVVAVSGAKYFVDPRDRQLPDVGHDSFFDYETLAAVRPDLVMLYGVDGPSVAEPKLKELGIPYIYIGDYLESSPLAKAEWTVALGAVVGSLDDARQAFDSIVPAYDALKCSVEDDGPKVMVNLPYGDNWFMPGGDGYMAQLIADAGGRYLLAGRRGADTHVISDEEALTLASQADVWVIPGNGIPLGRMRREMPEFARVPAVASGRVYDSGLRCTDGGGNDFYGSGIVHPDLILRDLRMIFHPDEAVDSLFTYFRKIE